MSGVPAVPSVLREVLDGRRAPGVHPVVGADGVRAAGVRSAVEGAGWRFAVLGPTPDRRAFHAAIADALDLPEHYGRNLDALHDALRDLGDPTVLWWDDWAALEAAHPSWFERVVAVLDRGGARARAASGRLEVLLAPRPSD